MQQNIGIGTALIKRVEELVYSKNCTRIYLTTTNDNINALRFYQRYGFVMCAIRLNELDYSRKIIPAIPLIGDNDIPVLHEIEFEMIL
jgi:ribosomal protein S18 acetylase RimI-like enzyme